MDDNGNCPAPGTALNGAYDESTSLAGGTAPGGTLPATKAERRRPTDVMRRAIDVSDLRKPKWWVPVSRAAGVHLTALASLAATAAALDQSLALAALAASVGAGVLALGYRGLENLVHGASHYDLFGRKGTIAGRPRAAMNDCVANLVIAVPVAQDVAAFRAGHLADHHAGFDQPRDPCRTRMLRHPDVQADMLPGLVATLLSTPEETVAFYKTVGAKPWMPVRALLWHLAVYVAPLSATFGAAGALAAWAMVMLPLFMLALPIVRGLAETGEHDYRRSQADAPLIERTFGHDGLANGLIHLFGDELHPEHHLWPDVGQYNLSTVRKRVTRAGFAHLFKRRKNILGPIVTG